jgi:DNA-binding LacI/PurR family transcriptional regulator
MRFVASTGFITMRAVARAAGVAPATVSKALRDDPTIPAVRRRDIRRVADQLGYRPNPMIAALMTQLRRPRRRNDPHHIAWIDLWTTEGPTAQEFAASPALSGARRRAGELGYEIEVYRVIRDHVGTDRLRQILLTRSQWGLIFPPVADAALRYPLEMSGLTGVAIGTSLREPAVNRVAHNHFQGGLLACRESRARGLERVGFVLSPWNDARVEGRWRAAYLVQQDTWPKSERLPPLLVGKNEKAVFERWMRRHRPDCIITAEHHVADWLRELNLPSVRVIWLALDVVEPGAWGVQYRSEELGAAAVEMVVGQIHRNERGLPRVPQTLLIDGIWVSDGTSDMPLGEASLATKRCS